MWLFMSRKSVSQRTTFAESEFSIKTAFTCITLLDVIPEVIQGDVLPE